MKNEALNYDFAAKGYGGVSPARSNQGPTRSKVIRAKNQAVGGYRKRCKQGKLCSATCIAVNKDCLVDLPVPLQREIRRAAISIARKQGLTPGSASDIRQGVALQQMAPSMKVTEGPKKTEKVDGKKVTKPRLEFDRSAKDKQRAERPRTLLEESLELQKRLPLLKGADLEDAQKRILQLDALSRGVKLPRNELEAMYDLLPANTRTALQNSGKATGRWYDGKDENGKDKFKGGNNGTRERGLAVFDMWMRQGGTDAYLGRNGKRFAPQDMDVEHIKPFSKGGLDAPSNWVLIRAGLNRKRQEQELESFITRLPKTPAEQRAYLSDLGKKDRLKRLKDKAMGNVNLKNITDQGITNPKSIGLDEKQLSKMLNSYGKLRDWGAAKNVPNRGEAGIRLQSGAPPPFRTGINFLYKNLDKATADRVAQGIKNTWNKELFGGNLEPQATLNKMMSSLSPHLTAPQREAVMADLGKWVKTTGQYGFSTDLSGGGGSAPRKMNAMEAHLAKYQ